MLKFEIAIPLEDASSNNVDTTSLQSAMEALASDSISHGIGQDTRWHAGNFIDQCNLWFWLIPDASLASAQSALATFVSGFTFSNAPYSFSYSVS